MASMWGDMRATYLRNPPRSSPARCAPQIFAWTEEAPEPPPPVHRGIFVAQNNGTYSRWEKQQLQGKR